MALNVSQAGTVTHYGDYSSVVNLSDSTPISYSEGEVTLDAAAGRSYYEGTLSEVELPWNIEISYKLDGKAVAPEELGGASGQLEIAIKTSKNEAVSGGFYDNYLAHVPEAVRHVVRHRGDGHAVHAKVVHIRRQAHVPVGAGQDH